VAVVVDIGLLDRMVVLAVVAVGVEVTLAARLLHLVKVTQVERLVLMTQALAVVMLQVVAVVVLMQLVVLVQILQ
jgi:hypothetical protein